jgi:hypothetical protein
MAAYIVKLKAFLLKPAGGIITCVKRWAGGPGVQAQAYNTSYSRVGDQEYHSSRPAQAKKIQVTTSQSIAGYSGMCL